MNEKIGLTIYFVSLAVMVLVLFFYLIVVRGAGNGSGETEQPTRVQNLIQLDIKGNYPATPKEVSTLYAEYVQCLYNDEYTNDEFEKLAAQLYKLYNDDYYKYFPWATYIEALREEVNRQKNNNHSFVAYVVFGATDVTYYIKDEVERANVKGTFSFREGENVYSTDGQFDLTKDENGNWRVAWWRLTDDSEGWRIPL